MIKTSISILSSYKDPEAVIKKINETSADFLHIDVFDGIFTSNAATNFAEMRTKLRTATKPLDVHIMSSYPSKLIDKVIALGPKRIAIHIESLDDSLPIINDIQVAGIEAGLVINPETSVKLLESYFSVIDYVLVMGVVPGRSGQSFLDIVYHKIDVINSKIIDSGFYVDIQVDGGITFEVASKLIKSGVTIISADTLVTKSNDFQRQIDKIKAA